MYAIKGTAERTLAALELLHYGSGVTTAEAASLLGIDNSNAYRLFKTMEARGFARKTGRRYYLGEQYAEIICFGCGPFKVASYAETLMKELVRQTNICAHLCMLTADGAAFIGQEFSSDIIQIVKHIGTVEPFHCTASGKAMLAFLPSGIRERIIGGLCFTPHTDRTVTDPCEYRARLDGIAAAGFATDIGEYHPDICCVCAPVFDENGLPRYAVGLSKPMTGGALPDFDKLGKILMKTSSCITAKIIDEKSKKENKGGIEAIPKN